MRKITVSLFVVFFLFLFAGCKNSEEVESLTQSPNLSQQGSSDNSTHKSGINNRVAYPYALNPGIFKKSPTVFSIVAWAHFPSPTQNVTQSIDVYECDSPNASNATRLGYNSRFIFNIPAGNHWYASLNRLTLSSGTKYVRVISKVSYPTFPYQHIKLYGFYLKDI